MVLVCVDALGLLCFGKFLFSCFMYFSILSGIFLTYQLHSGSLIWHEYSTNSLVDGDGFATSIIC